MKLRRTMELIRLFPGASRLPFLVGSLIPVCLGTALASAEHGLFSPLYLTLTLTGMAGAHLAVNFFNDYFDYLYEVDSLHPPRPLSGGSQVIQVGLETPAEYLGQGLVMSAVAIISALILAVITGPVILIFTFLGGFLGYFYSARPLLLSWRGLGEITTGFCFGPLVVAGAYYVQAGGFSITALLLSLVPGALITALLFVNQYPDYDDDRRAGKKTLVVRLGPRRALPLLYIFLAIAFAPLLPVNWLPLSPPSIHLALAGVIPAALATYHLTVSEGSDVSNNRPGKLILTSYTVTLTLLVGAFLLFR